MTRCYRIDFNDKSQRYYKEVSDMEQTQFFVTSISFNRYGRYQNHQICKPKDKPMKAVGKPITEKEYQQRKSEVLEHLTNLL